MPNHTNERLAKIKNYDGWMEVGVYTGWDDSPESMPVCLNFPDESPCMTSKSARRLAAALVKAADLADKTVSDG